MVEVIGLVDTLLQSRWYWLFKVILLATALVSTPVAWSTEVGGYADREDVQAYSRTLVDTHGFDAVYLAELFSHAQYRADIIEKISKPAEKVWTWGRYKKHLVSAERISKGIEFMRVHRATLERAEQVFGVAPEYVVAIIGIETHYGKITGSYPVLDALMTLGFDYPPRAKFFGRELTEFLLLAREEGKDPRALLGSYAGAMGYGQFISSSYRHYAVDFDGDGIRDIWSNPVDAIGSVANYFNKHHWRGDDHVALQLSVPDAGLSQIQKLSSTNPKLRLNYGDLSALGATTTATLAATTQVALFRLERDAQIEYWLGLHDFYVITRYNHSHLYGLAVYHLAQAINAGGGSTNAEIADG